MKSFDLKSPGSIKVAFPARLRRTSHIAKVDHRGHAEHDEDRDRLGSLLPREDPEHDAAHAEHGEHGADRIDRSLTGVGDVLHQLDA